jgi:hypothetical protein
VNTLNLGIFASHNGSNLQVIVHACKSRRLDANVSVIISNNSDSLALERAKKEDIACYHLSSKRFPQEDKLDEEIYNVLKRHSVDLIILAGYMKKLGKKVLQGYKNKILNIHPALLPKYGGKGMYGRFVHEAVFAHIDNYTHLREMVQIKYPKILHITDRPLKDIHNHVPIGQGDIDFRYIFKEILPNYDGRVIIEVFQNDEGIINSKNYIKMLLG